MASEFERIERLTRHLQIRGERVIRGPGDDAATVHASGVAVTSVDAVVENVHFSRAYTPIDAVGHKAVAAALSDIAAMGAEAGEIYVAAGLPTWFSDDDFDQLIGSIDAIAEQTGTTCCGGDLTASPVLWLSVTAVGWAADADSVVYRDGARPGDLLAVTGEIGGSALGLALLRETRKNPPAEVSPEAADLARRRHLRPLPRLAAGRAIAHSGASAMTDVSDGLALDARHIAESSGCSLTIELDRLPLATGVTDAAAAAASGEEYELLCALPPNLAKAARSQVERTGTTLTVIGEFGSGNEVLCLSGDGRPVEVGGHDHFS